MINGSIAGNLVLADDIRNGILEITGPRITAVTVAGSAKNGGPLILPGFINIHFHRLGKFGITDLA